MTNRKPPGPDPRAARPPGQQRVKDPAPARVRPAPVRRGDPNDPEPIEPSTRFGAASPRELADPPRTSRPAAGRTPAEAPGAVPRQKAARARSANASPRKSARPQVRRTNRLWIAAGAIVAILLALVGALFVAADSLIPVDTIRDRLAAEVKTRTGRDLVMGKRPSITLWPRLAVSLSDVTLSDPPSMGRAPFAKAALVEAQAELWPLLSGQVKLERLVLKNPVIDLRVDQNGRRNWDFAEALPPAPIRYAQAARKTDAAPLPKELEDFAKGATQPQGSSGKSAGDLALRHLQIVNGTVRHADARTGIDETMTGVDATLVADDLASPLMIDGKGDWRGRTVSATTEARPFRAVLERKPVALRTTIKGQGFDIAYAGNLDAGAPANVDGKITIKAASIQDLGAWIGRPVGGGIANGPLDITATARSDANTLTLNDLALAVEGMTARGNLAVTLNGVPRPRVAGNLQFSALNLDQLAAVRVLDGRASASNVVPAAASQSSAAPASIDDLLKSRPAVPAAAPLRPQVRGFTGRPGWSDEPIEFSSLGILDADLKLAFGALTTGKLKTGRGQVSLGLTNKVARLDIQDLQLYDGRAKGVVTTDATNPASAVVGANVTMDGISSLDFLRDAGGVDIVSGKARISASLAGQGTTERQIVETLTGKAEIAMGNGALIGISIPKVLQALSQGRQPSFERVPADRSEFSELTGSVNIVNGLAQNQDLRFTTREVRVTGAGAINLPARTIDYVTRPKLTGPQTIQVGQVTLNVGQVEVPVKITGTFDRIAVAPDLAGVVKNPNQAIEAVKQLDKKEVESTVKGVIEGDPAAKAKARDFLKNLLKQ